MPLYFCADFRKGSFADTMGRTVTVTGSPEIKKGEKGMAATGTSNNYLSISPAVTITGAFSVVVYIRSIRSVPAYFIGKSDGSFFFGRLGDGANSIGYKSGDCYIYYGGITLNDNKWHCLVLTVPDLTKNGITNANMYFDGVLAIGSVDVSGTLASTFAFDILIKSTADRKQEYSFIAVHDHVFTEAERIKAQRDFEQSFPIEKPSLDYQALKPMDLSREVNNTLGSELVTNGGFDTDTAWTKLAAGNTIVSGVGRNIDAINTSGHYQSILTVGKTYKLIYTISNYVKGGIQVNDGLANVGTIKSANGTYSETFTSTSTVLIMSCSGSSTTCDIDNISVKELTGLVAAYNMIPQGNTLVDISGNGHNGTLNAGLVSTKNGIRAKGISNISIATMPIIGTGDYCFSFRVKYDNLTDINGIIGGALNSLSIYNNGTTLRVGKTDVNNIDLGTIPVNVFCNISIVRSGTVVNSYLNGVFLATAADANNYSVAQTVLFSYLPNVYYFKGECEDFRFHNRALTLAEIQAYSNQFSQRITLLEDFRAEGASGVATVPTGWTKTSGSFAINEATADDANLKTIKKGTKYLSCLTAGVISIPSKQAYGTWEWDWYKGADGNILTTYIISSKSNTNTNGYLNHIWSNENFVVNRIDSGIGTNLAYATASYVANNTWYRTKITRSTSGVFTMYIKGGSFVPTEGYDGWTLFSTLGGDGTNPVTDNTYTTSEYFVLDLNDGDRIANIKLTEGIKV